MPVIIPPFAHSALCIYLLVIFWVVAYILTNFKNDGCLGKKILFFPPMYAQNLWRFLGFLPKFLLNRLFVYIFVTHEMTEKLFIRSVIYKLLAARKKCYRFFAKKREKHDPLSKKKRLFSAWNFTARVCLQMTQQFCAFSSRPTSPPFWPRLYDLY